MKGFLKILLLLCANLCYAQEKENEVKISGKKTIHEAANEGDIETVKKRLSSGVDVNIKNKAGGTLLHAAAVKGRVEVIKLLISKGANINTQNNGGLTPLSLALNRKHSETVDLLRKHGAKTTKQLKRIIGETNSLEEKQQKANVGAKPIKELTLQEKVVGFYEGKSNQDTNRISRLFLWENGEVESYRGGKKRFTANWTVNKNGELNIEVKQESEKVSFVFRINPDHSLTGVSATMNGQREVISEEDQITFAKIRGDLKGSPPTVKSMLAIIGEPLSKDEENFVGRRKGLGEDFDSTGYSSKSHVEVVYRRDHTYSLSIMERYDPNVGKEGCAEEVVEEVIREVEEEVVHGIWRIIGDHIYFLDLVFNNEKNPESEQKVMKAILIVSDNKSYSFKIPESKSEKGEVLPGWKCKEEPAEKLKHPGMWPYNSPNSLDGFDLLTAYKYANKPER
ncbi:MAG: ankyrin repeat domain-containing protein [Verrucomicrobiota bacterium]|nr:ankyrin repeat domain-containing protein [Verrucomicrobiota bacterium]